MAVDTLSKRVSALNISLPIPDGTISAGDRQHVLWTYSGILAAAPAAVVIIGKLIASQRRATLMVMQRITPLVTMRRE